MAIQDFLSGGFYGKVGDVVGQRWHNKRYVRAYVKPTNPNTPAQQTNRGMFAKATKLAQLAFNINKGSTAWDTTAKGEFSSRVGTAMSRLKAGMSDSDALPLYPDGYAPSHTLSGPSCTWDNIDEQYIFTCSDGFNVQDRTFGVVIHALNAFTNQWEDLEFTHHNTSHSKFYFEWPFDKVHAFPPGSTFTASTEDDASHEMLSVFYPTLNFQQSIKHSFYSRLLFGPLQQEGPFLQFNPHFSPVILGHSGLYDLDVYYFNTSGNTWDYTTDPFMFEEDGTVYGEAYLNSPYSYPTGSKIVGSEHEIDTGLYTIYFTWDDYPFSWP